MLVIPTGIHILFLPIGIGKVRMKTPDRAQNPPRIRPKKNNKLFAKHFLHILFGPLTNLRFILQGPKNTFFSKIEIRL